MLDMNPKDKPKYDKLFKRVWEALRKLLNGFVRKK